LYAPDYAINAGGLINASAELRPGGYDRSWALAKVVGIGKTLADIFTFAEQEQSTTSAVADCLAERRLAHGLAIASHGTQFATSTKEPTNRVHRATEIRHDV
ncbi:MAG: hypothetical protein GTO41_20305, partial [Burkholderiales bacterium]|nr:hypothetical protein [Burkholderiales bacterium]